jgi:hypothetical protein
LRICKNVSTLNKINLHELFHTSVMVTTMIMKACNCMKEIVLYFVSIPYDNNHYL